MSVEMSVYTLQDMSYLSLELACLWQAWPVSSTQWGVLYSKALSPWRHLDKVMAIVCFFVFFNPQFYSLPYEKMRRNSKGKGPFFGCFLKYLQMDWQK